MLETIAVKDQRTNWPSTLFSIVRVSKQHVGWRSATYLGKRYQVFYGLKGEAYIDLSSPHDPHEFYRDTEAMEGRNKCETNN